jgi:hypothetical protein
MVLLLYMCVCQIKRRSGLSDIVSVGKGKKQNNLYVYICKYCTTRTFYSSTCSSSPCAKLKKKLKLLKYVKQKKVNKVLMLFLSAASKQNGLTLSSIFLYPF